MRAVKLKERRSFGIDFDPTEEEEEEAEEDSLGDDDDDDKNNLDLSALLSRSLSLAGLIVGLEILIYPTLSAAFILIVQPGHSFGARAVSFFVALVILFCIS